jgi:hypothetical protein
MKQTCIVIEQGWIIIGKIEEAKTTGDSLFLSDSSVVRRWSNGKGIGGIAKEENKDEYILDYIGDVEIERSKILFKIPCEW